MQLDASTMNMVICLFVCLFGMCKSRVIAGRFRKSLINVKFGWIKVYRLGLWRDMFSSSLGRWREGEGGGENTLGLVGRAQILGESCI